MREVTFEIRVRPTKDGFSLSCDGLLPWPLWYRSVADAVSFARWHARDCMVTIRVYRANGDLAKEGKFPVGSYESNQPPL